MDKEQFELPLERLEQEEIERIPQLLALQLPNSICKIETQTNEKVELSVMRSGVRCIFEIDPYTKRITVKVDSVVDSFVDSHLHNEPAVKPIQSEEAMVDEWKEALKLVIDEIVHPTLIEIDTEEI